ncbi:MAG: hypothetical protein EOR47_16205 [Mesorhizobium sp.]|uniref:hypothetical protein n=1 Tax=Mesorhizobium sp. TaxID=1871066 RepID=UPI000FE9B4BD|nr:hypothetical protein [Mesorhizobium sp.]RWK48870.1 MAG: hypothetical protein EOR47_16205 [Mesorhizobium sp.]
MPKHLAPAVRADASMATNERNRRLELKLLAPKALRVKHGRFFLFARQRLRRLRLCLDLLDQGARQQIGRPDHRRVSPIGRSKPHRGGCKLQAVGHRFVCPFPGICAARASDGSWLACLMLKKPRMLVAITLANKMACGIWAMLTKQEDYRDPARCLRDLQQRT